MKAFSIAVAVTLVLAFVCILEGSAFPLTGVQEPEEAGSNDTPVAAHQEMSMESWMTPSHIRRKRHGLIPVCHWCCEGKKGCRVCLICKFTLFFFSLFFF
uniref:Hepcidin-like n=1 Tax=Stegastes partitus TaxID=144197 RepID=A0A3B5APS7_9TELE